MFFDELSNDEWARLSALVSDEPAVRLNRRGRPRAEPRIVANAVLWILTTGEPWSKLPGRYPSGPTCRRRFEEWQANGTLIEMVRLLSDTGRTFAYVPEPTPPVVARPAPEVEPPKPRSDDTVRGVFWKSPESWQARNGATSITNGWRPLGAMADMTRQLAGAVDEDPAADEIVQLAHVDGVGRDVQSEVGHTKHAAQSAFATHAQLHREMLDARAEQLDARAEHDAPYDGAGAAQRFDSPYDLYQPDTAHAQDEEVSDLAFAHVHEHDVAGANYHAPLWMSLATPGVAQIDDARGYLIYVAAEQVARSLYRAWAEIMKDGRRIERSGLIGPRFDNEDAARHFAYRWATEWIDRECGVTADHAMAGHDGGAAVAEHAQVAHYARSVGVQQPARVLAPAYPAAQESVSQSVTQSAQSSTQSASQAASPAPMHVTRQMPESAAARNALPATANRNGNSNGGPQPVAVPGPSSGSPAGSPTGSPAGTSPYPPHVNAQRMQLRRYPSEGNTSADKTTDRFPPTRKLLSHVR